MRYAIFFTPPVSDPLTHAAARWLGRDAFSGASFDQPACAGLGTHEIAYYTAVPRRYGFHGVLKAPFRLADDKTESMLLRAMMRFSGSLTPFALPPLEVARLGDFHGLVPSRICETMHFLASSVVQEFDGFRAPLTEAEIELRDPGGLSAAQFSNLHRWGFPHVLDEFRFHMTLTGSVGPREAPLFDRALRDLFDPLLTGRPVEISNLALFVEDEPGAPFRVHSLHPMGKVSARKRA